MSFLKIGRIKIKKTLTPEKAPIYGLDGNTPGVIFSSVIRNSAAYNAGLTHKDVILEIDGKPLENYHDLQTRIAMLSPGTKIVLTLWRNGKRDKLEIELGRSADAASLMAEEQIQTVANVLGFKIQDVNETLAQYYGFEGTDGVVVIEVDSESQAKQNGIIQGTLIKEVNHQAVKNVSEFIAAIDAAKQNNTGNVFLWGNIKGTDYNFFLKLP